ncbi:MAG: molybdopterin-guanine dinucleotide biosynthesis protein B [Alphaproteobacteria bacterium]|nr:molybdopterin-guanine dinucleotide biosynthesis protein B [Alphaproteobacteria bacterium]MDE2163013.1 molybdopterin-guanine dinucleotide biosynthesis protein B [Alphaproteobacteria bacterium]MDE2267089.1 molybdopterin-guanine dinucleotide biosynthesis protein B [Alphaproteobacteria bacterium]MDE2499119.1 molybdopterin-guanine dinucleotide biosynthesis protein B [Alphaproteobacteria bacterium]
MKIIGIVGWKNNGKTTLIEGLIAHFARAGLRVATVKHAHHEFDMDHPGKDSFRHRAAGAREVLVSSSRRWALLHEADGEAEPALENLLAHLSPADLIIVEGYKQHAHAKIEVILNEQIAPIIAETDPNVIAIATNISGLATALPTLPLDRPDQVAAFITEKLALAAPHLKR